MSDKNNKNSDFSKEFAQRKAAALKESNFYSMNNEYLTNTQKAYIEIWYQSPIRAFWIGYILSTILIPDIRPVFPAIFASLIVGFLNTKLKEKDFERLLTVFTICSPFWLYLFLVFELVQNDIAWVSAITLFIISWSGLGVAGHGIQNTWAKGFVYAHPKYGAAKALFGIEKFPFEELTNDEFTEQRKRGSKTLSYLATFLLVIATIIWIKP
tara:strand:- start:40 stop:675 length:636 start_codon:yes stop_codon:yes gene_type:complete